MPTIAAFESTVDHLRALEPLPEAPEDPPSSPELVEILRSIVLARNIVEHHATTLIGYIDRRGVARQHGMSTRELVISLGFSPGVASRLIRIATADLPALRNHVVDGAVSSEHADAIVRGMSHIAGRSAEPATESVRLNHMTSLLAHHFSGATPAELTAHARTLGNRHAVDTGGLPAAEDRTLNALNHTITTDGRLRVRADLDVEVGEKLTAPLESLSAPRPEPDGPRDTRSAQRRRADALETVLDIAARATDVAASPPRTQVLLTVPADTPDLASLQFMGSVTAETLQTLTCDGSVATMIVDDERVPIDVSRDKRLFPAHLRRALYVRDECCIKCGAPANRTQAHHIVHWAEGGDTSLSNGCLLCPSCHADIHHFGWDVTLGFDGHPRLIPPATVDSHRRPRPAYNRRTLTVDTLAA